MEFGSKKLALSKGEVDLWFAFTEQPDSDTYEAVLSDDELDHLQELQLPEHRQEFLVSRALLRDSLSRYAPVSPKAWKFSSNRFGKPELAPIHQELGLQFNVAHTHGLTVCAVTVDASVGVDVEHHADNAGLLDVADDYFSSMEVAELRSHPAEHQNAYFFRYWTLKESFIKAKGEGLSIPLDSFSFQISDDRVVFIPASEEVAARDERWFFELLCLSELYTSALAVSAPLQQLRIFEAIPLAGYRQLADVSELFGGADSGGAYQAGIC